MSLKCMLEFEGGGHSTGRVTELLAKKISVGESRGGEVDNLAFLAAETREEHKNETPRLCPEFQRKQPKKRANDGRGQQTRIQYCPRFIFQKIL